MQTSALMQRCSDESRDISLCLRVPEQTLSQPQVCLEIAVFILTFPPGGRFGKRKFDYFLVDKHVDKVHE